jgi:hypothetical protein
MASDQPDRQTPSPRRRSWGRFLLRSAVLYLLTPYLAVIAVMTAFQRQLIYQPSKTGRLLAQDVSSPHSVVDDVQIIVANGLALHGWRFYAEADVHEPGKLLVLYFPGNAGCRRHRLDDCRDFTRLGCDVLLFDYRGYGENGGSPSEENLADDARLVWNFATQDLGFPPDRLVLFGESLGGAVATRLAAERSQAGAPPAALILNSTFSSLGDAVAWHYPAFPFRYLLFDRFPSVDRMSQVKCPVLQFHGTADEIVPFPLGRRLFDAAPRSANGVDSRFVAIADGQHNFISMGDMHGAVSDLLIQLDARDAN